MKYFKHMDNGRTKYFAAEDSPSVNIPPDSNNTDYIRMMEEVDLGISTIEDVDDTLE